MLTVGAASSISSTPTATPLPTAAGTRLLRASRGVHHLNGSARWVGAFRAIAVLLLLGVSLWYGCCLTIESEERETWTADVLADVPGNGNVDETL